MIDNFLQEINVEGFNEETKDGKVLVGYTGSAAAGVVGNLQIRDLKEKLEKTKNKKKAQQIEAEIKQISKKIAGTPVYVPIEEYKRIKAHQELHEYDTWL